MAGRVYIDLNYSDIASKIAVDLNDETVRHLVENKVLQDGYRVPLVIEMTS